MADWIYTSLVLGLLAHIIGASAFLFFRDRLAADHWSLKISLVLSGVSLVAFLSAAILWGGGTPLEFEIWKTESLGSFGFLFNGLTAILTITVSVLATVILFYSRNYLRTDQAQGRFFFWAHLTIFSVLVMIAANHFAGLLLFWLSTSLCLHQLLTLYSHRRLASEPARLKFIISRFGDGALLVAGSLLWMTFGTLEFQELSSKALASDGYPPSMLWAAFFLVLGAMTKSAQVPFHSWLPETVETPTPVSALMHAGVINAGGFLILRTYDAILLAPWAADFLIILGAITVLVSASSMMVAPDVKRQLAHSTSAQMGFMFMQLGFALPGAALVHMIGHAFYKAYAFLSSGDLVKRSRIFDVVSLKASQFVTILFLGWLPLVLAFSVPDLLKPGQATAAGILIIALLTIFFASQKPFQQKGMAWIYPILVSCLGVGLISFANHLGLWILQRPHISLDIAHIATLSLAIILFSVLAFLQTMQKSLSSSLRMSWFVLARNGFYIGHSLQRLLGLQVR